DDEVLIKVKRCGICGSDLHAYKGLHPDYILPLIPGHEFSGDVIEVGKNVEKIKVGDKVAVEPLVVCGKCRFCIRGEYNRCIKLKVIGCQTNGAFAEYISVPERWVYKLPEKISYEEGAMIEPLAVAVHAVRRVKDLGENVLVLGAGTIGLLTAQVARAFGATNVFITDIVDWKVDFAEKLGIDYPVNSLKTNLKDFLKKYVGETGVDTTFEAVGSNVTLNQALELTRKGGNIVIIGIYEKPMVNINVMNIVNKELNVYGSLVYRWDFEKAIGLVEKKLIDVKSLVSSVVKLDNIEKGFKSMIAREKGIIKIQVDPTLK
ncbi:MAG TPA: hypothetical protein ENG40_02910, partial [Thermoprotei archaeon]|nr:hypothetical protein [Thermoprotei archaeon]